jgi:hypothetical protein
MAQLKKEAVTLDPNDPFDAALIPIVQTNRRKRADYARDGDPFSSFRTSSDLIGLTGFGPVEAGLFNITQKLTRLKSLRENGRMDDPKNEAVADTYLDMGLRHSGLRDGPRRGARHDLIGSRLQGRCTEPDLLPWAPLHAVLSISGRCDLHRVAEGSRSVAPLLRLRHG